MEGRLAPQLGFEVLDESDQAGTEIAHQLVARKQEGGAAAVEGQELVAMGAEAGHADGVDIVLPFAGGDAKAQVLVILVGLLDAGPDAGPAFRLVPAYVVEQVIAFGLG